MISVLSPPLSAYIDGQGGILMGKRTHIFYSALMLTGSNLLLRLISTVFQVYLSSRIGAAGIGLLQLVLSVGSMAMTAGMAGIRTATMYLAAEELGKNRRQNVSRILSRCFLYSLICSLTVACILYFFAPTLAEQWIGNGNTTGILRLFAVFLPVVCLCGVMTGYFTAANRIKTLAVVEIAEQILSMTLTILLLTFWAEQNPVKSCYCVVIGSSFGACLTLSVLLFLRLREKKEKPQPIPVARRLLNTAVPLALADDLKVGINTTENLMVPKRLALFSGTHSALAAYGTVCGMVFPVLMFPAAILFGLSELLIPELARCNAAGSTNRIHYLVERSLRVALIYGLTFSGLLYLLSHDLCIVLYNNPDAGKYLRWFALLIPMLYCDCVTDAMTKGLGQQKKCVQYNIITSAMDVLLLYFLLPRYGIPGYFFSFLITHLLNFILSLRRLLKITRIRIPLFMPMMSIALLLLAIWIVSYVSSALGRTAAFLLLFFSAMYLTGVVNREDLSWMRGLLSVSK